MAVIGNAPFQGLVSGGNIIDASIEGVDLSTSAIAARLGYTPVDPGAAAIIGGTINGTTIGATTAASGAFTNLSASGTLGVTGVATLASGAVLNTPASVTLTNATGLPVATGVSGLGTGIATALAVNVGSAGAPLVNGGVLGTPSSGTVTNLTGTASININGTVGATTAASGAFTTLSASGAVTLTGEVSVSANSGAGAINVGSSAGRAQYQYINFGGAVGGTDYAWQIGRNSSTANVGPADGFYIYDLKASATRLAVDGSGNLMVGGTIDINPPTSANAFAFAKSDNTLRFSNTTAAGKVWTIGTATPGIASQGDFFSFGRYSGSAWAEAARFDNAGRLMIGTTSNINATTALQVAWTNNTRIGIDSPDSQGFYFTKAGANNGTFRVDTNGNYEWYTKTVSQAMTLSTSGGLSIGPTADAGPGNILLTGNSGTIFAAATTGSRSYIELYNNSTGDMSIATTYSTAVIKFLTGNTTTPTERLRITNTGLVAIGNPNNIASSGWSSAYALQVGNSANFYGDGIYYNWVSGLSLNSYRSANVWYNTTTGIPTGRFEIANGGGGGNVGGFAWYWGTGGTGGLTASQSQFMTLDTSGRLLIGTTNSDVGGSVDGVVIRPEGRLHLAISGTGFYDYTFYADRRGTNNTGKILVMGLGGYLKASIGVLGTNSVANDGGITFNTIYNNDTQTERMRITDNSVIFGYNLATSATLTKTFAGVHAAANRGASITFGLDDGSMGGMIVKNVASANPAFNSQYIEFHTHQGGISAGQRMRITADGNVIIGGGTSPRASANLDILGDKMVLGSNPSYYATIDYNAGTGLLSLAAESGGNISFKAGTSEKVRILNNGKVNIGGVSEFYTSGYAMLADSFYIDVPVENDNPGLANTYHIQASISHANWGGYGCLLDTWYNARGNVPASFIEQYDTRVVTSGNGGSWTISKPSTGILRITKNAGTYPGNAYYWIRVTMTA